MSSGLLVIPGVSTLLCLPLMLSLKTIILKYFLVCLFLLSPCCGHRNRRPDLTVSVVPSPRFVLFVFSSVLFVPVFCPSRQASPHAASPHARRSREFTPPFAALPSRGSREFTPPFAALPSRGSREFTPPFAALPSRGSRDFMPPFAALPSRGSRDFMPPFAAQPSRRSRELTPPFAAQPSRRSWEFTPPFADQPALSSLEMTPPSTANPSPPACLWLNARRPASDSMPAGLPLTQCPPACLWFQLARSAADSSSPDCRWLKLAGLPLTQARRIAADSCHWSSAGKANSPLSVSRRRPRPTSVSRASSTREGQPAVRGHSARSRLRPLQPAGPCRCVVKPAGCCHYCQASRLWYPQPAAAVLTSQPAVAVFDQTVTTVFLTVCVCLAPKGSWYPWASPRKFWGG